METLQAESPSKVDYLQEDNVLNQEKSDELTLVMKTVTEQESAMPETLKKEKQADAPSLANLFEQTLEQKGEADSLQKHWTSENELEVEGLSNTTLHSFVLEAEKLGKKITYTKTLSVKISD